jgi:hypothetical protein
MSYLTVAQSTNDADLQRRVMAACAQEGWNSAELGPTAFGKLAREDPAGAMLQIVWPVAIDNAAAYESALLAGNPAPGADPAVITDAAILAGVQAHWPADPV